MKVLALFISALFIVRRPPFFVHHVARFYVNEWQIIGKEAAWCSRLPYCDGGWQDLSLSPSFRLSSSPSLAIPSVLSSLFAPRCYLARNPMSAFTSVGCAYGYRETCRRTRAPRNGDINYCRSMRNRGKRCSPDRTTSSSRFRYSVTPVLF